LQVGTSLTIQEEDYPRLYLKAVPIEPVPAEVMETEYFTLLARIWALDTDAAATMDEARRLVDRLDELYQALHRQGRKVPARLPVERNRDQVQPSLAL